MCFQPLPSLCPIAQPSERPPARSPPIPCVQVLARLIKGYNFRFQPRWHAVDLIETLHIVLGMLDRLSTSGVWAGGGLRWAHARHADVIICRPAVLPQLYCLSCTARA